MSDTHDGGAGRVARTSLYDRLQRGESFDLSCHCGRLCPMRVDPVRETLIVDHGGEAVFVMPADEWAAVVNRRVFTLRQSSYWAWLKRVHEYEAGQA